MNKMREYMKQMGPAWLAIALNIGGATCANAGSLASKTGYTYLWAIIPEVFVIWIICIMFSRVTTKSGMSPIEISRTKIGGWAAWVTAISVFIVNTVFHAIQYAIIGNVLNTLFGISPKFGAVLGAVFVLAVVFNPAKGQKSIAIIQKILQYMVWILLASFLVCFFVVDINWGDVGKGFIPSLSGSSSEIVTLAGLMGAAIAINVPVLGAYGAKQNKWTSERDGLSFFELTYTNIMLIIVQLVVMIVCGAVLFPNGVVVTGAGTMAQCFEPFAGRFGVILMCIGLLGSVMSTMVAQCLVCGYIVTDVLKLDCDVTSKSFKLSELLVTIFGVSAPLLGWNAFSLSTYGGGFNLTFFPIASILFLYLYNREDIMGEKKASTPMNIGIAIAILFSLAATVNYWVNLLA